MRNKEQLQEMLSKSLQGGNPLFWLDPASETSTPVMIDESEKETIESDDFEDDTILLVRPLGVDEGNEIEVLPTELYPASLEHVVIGIPIMFDDDKTDLLTDIEDFIKDGDMQSAFNICFDHNEVEYFDEEDTCRWHPLDDFFRELNAGDVDTENFFWYHCKVYVPADE